MLVAIAVVTSKLWLDGPEPEQRPYFKDDRTFQRWLVGIMVVQLVLGAAQRHLSALLIVHISLAAIVVLLAIMVGVRAWGLYRGTRPVEQLGKLLVILTSVQVFLGIAALGVTGGLATVGAPTTLEITVTTTHQATGAVLLALSVALLFWTQRVSVGAEEVSSSKDRKLGSSGNP